MTKSPSTQSQANPSSLASSQGQPHKVYYTLVVIMACGLISSCFGVLINISGLFFQPLSADFQVGQGAAAFTLTLTNICQAVVGLLVPTLLKKIGLKPLVIAGTLAEVVPSILLARASSMGQIYLWNAIRGAGAGLIGMVLVTILINNWYVKRKAIMTSIAIGISGLVGAVLSPILSGVIASHGWRTAYMVEAFVMLAFNLPALLAPITLTPGEKGMVAYGAATLDIQAGAQKAAASTGSTHSKEITPFVYAMLLIYGFLAGFVSALPQHYVGIAKFYQIAAAGAFMLSASMVMNTLGKVLVGALVDKIGAKKTLLGIVSLVTLSILAFFVPQLWVLMLGAGACGFCFALPTVGVVTFTQDLFGSENYSKAFPPASLTATLANAVGTAAIGFIYDAAQSYAPALILLLLMGFGQLATIFFAYKMNPNKAN